MARCYYEINTQTQKTMNKNAYEIRLELLQLAHGDIMTRYHEHLEAQRDSIPHDEKGNRDISKIDLTLPDTAEIIKRANELYSFIEGK
jgi:hypothetical protein